MFTLYGRNNTGSVAVAALLEELDLKYQFIPVPIDEPGADFLKLNPLGQVPVLALENGECLTESAAILIYLADLKPELGLSPKFDAPERGPFLRWMVYLAANTYMADLRFFYPDRYGDEGVKLAALRDLERDRDILAKTLGDKPYFLDQFSALDIYATMLLIWMRDDCARVMKLPDHLLKFVDRVLERPKIRAAFKNHGFAL